MAQSFRVAIMGEWQIVATARVCHHRYSLKMNSAPDLSSFACILLVAGNQGGMKSLGYFSYGLQVFDLCTDQICRFMETPDMDKGAILMIIVI